MKYLALILPIVAACGSSFGGDESSSSSTANASSSVDASSSAGGSLGASTATSSSSSSTGSGGAGGAATASSATASTASSSTISTASASSTGTCMPTKTCDSEGIKCGKTDDGCGNLIDCGQFKRDAMCDYTSTFSCDCPTQAKQFAFGCNDGGNVVSASQQTLPPYDDCDFFPDTGGGPALWCCPESVAP